MLSRPVTPGPSSRTLSRRQDESSHIPQKGKQPTNRDKYENKPMPKLPMDESPGAAVKKPYIQPAIPLMNKLPTFQKPRAVTDPVEERTRTNSKKPSVSQLRRKFSFTKIERSSGGSHPPVPATEVPEKAQEILGLNNQRSTTPAPVKEEAEIVAGGDRAFEVGSSVVKQAALSGVDKHSTQDKTHPTLSSSDAERKTQHQDGLLRTAQPDQKSQLPKISAYGSIGRLGVIQQGPLHSSGSFRGVIETVPDDTNERDAKGPTHSSMPNFRDQCAPQVHQDSFPPGMYSPSVYDGVWEKNPAVVSTNRWIPVLLY